MLIIHPLQTLEHLLILRILPIEWNLLAGNMRSIQNLFLMASFILAGLTFSGQNLGIKFGRILFPRQLVSFIRIAARNFHIEN